MSLTVPRPAIVVCVALSAVGAGFGVASVGVTLRFRHLRLVKMSSPWVNLVIALGCVLGYASCVLMAFGGGSGSASAAGCWAQAVCLASGFTCALGAMFAKTWRVRTVFFAAKRAGRTAIKDWHLFIIVAILLLVDAIVFIVWANIDPIAVRRVHLSPQEDLEAGIIKKWHLDTCQADHLAVWKAVLIGKNGLILVFGIFFAWETRKVHLEALNDSKQIGICVYNILIMGAIGVSLSFVLPADQVALNFLLVSMCIIICASTTLLLVFGSKILMLIRHGPSKVDDLGNAISTVNGNGTAGVNRGDPSRSSSKC